MSAVTDSPSLPTTAGRWADGDVAVPIALSAAAFVAIQAGLALYNLHVASAIIARAGARSPTHAASLVPPSVPATMGVVLGGALVVYASFVLTEAALVARRHRLLWMAPAVIFVLLPVVTSHGTPQAIGTPWILRCYDVCATPWYLGPWVGAVVGLLLVLLPGLALAAHADTVLWPERLDGPAVAAIALCLSFAIMIDRTSTVLGHGPPLPAFAAVVAFGLLGGVHRHWWPWAIVLFALVAAGALDWAVSDGLRLSGWRPSIDLPAILGAAVAFLMAGLLASTWEPLAAAFRRLHAHPAILVLAVNALNIADAIFTEFAVRARHAVELNPLVRYGGLPLKIAVVGALSYLLYRRRPSALIWPAIALLWVVCYHVNGLVVAG